MTSSDHELLKEIFNDTKYRAVSATAVELVLVRAINSISDWYSRTIMIWTTSRPIRATPSGRFNELFCALRTMLSINEIYDNTTLYYVTEAVQVDITSVHKLGQAPLIQTAFIEHTAQCTGMQAGLKTAPFYIVLGITLANVDRFSKFFRCWTIGRNAPEACHCTTF